MRRCGGRGPPKAPEAPTVGRPSRCRDTGASAARRTRGLAVALPGFDPHYLNGIQGRPRMAGSQEALDRFERQTAWPMMALALAIIPLLLVPLFVDFSAVGAM